LEQAVSTGLKTAKKLGKRIEFEVSSEEIELPVKHLTLVSETLLHLVRNAIDHGIKATAGGKINIDVLNYESRILLRVADNGMGIDIEKIRSKAIAKNLIEPEEKISPRELIKLIFTHGFSTSDEVTEISGRGVGLDAVRGKTRQSTRIVFGRFRKAVLNSARRDKPANQKCSQKPQVIDNRLIFSNPITATLRYPLILYSLLR
jgi:anti-sigma regulatory factor (Ser/Thr protein kinase)